MIEITVGTAKIELYSSETMTSHGMYEQYRFDDAIVALERAAAAVHHTNTTKYAEIMMHLDRAREANGGK